MPGGIGQLQTGKRRQIAGHKNRAADGILEGGSWTCRSEAEGMKGYIREADVKRLVRVQGYFQRTT